MNNERDKDESFSILFNVVLLIESHRNTPRSFSAKHSNLSNEIKEKKKEEMNVTSYGSNCARSFLFISFSGVRFEQAQGKRYPPSTKE